MPQFEATITMINKMTAVVDIEAEHWEDAERIANEMVVNDDPELEWEEDADGSDLKIEIEDVE